MNMLASLVLWNLLALRVLAGLENPGEPTSVVHKHSLLHWKIAVNLQCRLATTPHSIEQTAKAWKSASAAQNYMLSPCFVALQPHSY